MRHIAKYHRMRPLVHAAVSTFFCYVFFSALNSVVFAGPEGAEVIHGRVSFQQNGLNTVITASDKSIVNYKSFNIARPEAVQFVQPHSNASVLNRISSANPTHINGTLTANGRVFFVNPAGVYIGHGAKINVNQLVASGLNISNSDFINGKYHFSGGQGSVVNRGDITAEKVHLIGKQVANYGTINCPGGYVVMAAGDRVFLGKPGNDLTVEVDTELLPESTDLDMGVCNEGTINAAGGEIVLAAAGDIYSQAISNVGTLSASVRDGDAGGVKLIAKNGNINNRGSIKTTSKSGRGGTVTTEGSEVINSGTVDVTGSEGGQVTVKGKRVGQFGTIHADGSNSHGGNVTLTADEVVALGSDSLTTANAELNGNGGDINAASPDAALLRPAAKIEAKGGTLSGNGGSVEVSGEKQIEISGTVDASAANGTGGTFHIDPTEIRIVESDETQITDLTDLQEGEPRLFQTNANANKITDETIEMLLNNGTSVMLDTSYSDGDGPGLSGAYEGSGDIIQEAGAKIDFIGTEGSVTLELIAERDIRLDGGIVSSEESSGTLGVTLTAQRNIAIPADVTTNGGDFTSSGVDFDNTGGAISTGVGAVNLEQSGNVTVDSVNTSNSTVMIHAGRAIRESGDDPEVDITGSVVTMIADSGGIGPLDVTASISLSAGTSEDGGNILIDSIGDLPIGIVNAGAGNVTLNATGAIRDDVADLGEPVEVESDTIADGTRSPASGYEIAFTILPFDVVGSTINLTADSDGIGTPASVIEEDVEIRRDGVLEVIVSQELNANTTADGGDIHINSIGNLPVGFLNAKKDAGAIGNVTLNSTASINDAFDDKEMDIVAGMVTLTAVDEIGGNPTDGKNEDILGAIETDITILEEVRSNNGDIVIIEQGDVKLGDIFADAGSILLEAINGAMTHQGETIEAETGIMLQGSGNITTNSLETNEGNISINSKDGDLIINGNVTAQNSGVSIIADTGKIYTEWSAGNSAHLNQTLPALNVAINGYSNDTEDYIADPYDVGSPGGAGVVLPRETSKAAIVIRSKEDLQLGSRASLTAGGTYVAGHATHSNGVDDRPGVGFKSTDESSGDPIDVAIYVGSYDFESQTGGNVTVDSTVKIESGGTMVIDAENTVMPFGETFINSWRENNDSTNRLEVVSRKTQTLNQAVNLGTLPYANEVLQGKSVDSFGDSTYVLRGKGGAEVLRSIAEVPRSMEVPPLNYLDDKDEEYVSLPSAAELLEETEPLQLLVIRGGKYVKAQRNMVLKRGDEIKTPPGMTAFIHFEDGSEIIMMPDTDIVIENPTIFTKLGRIIARVRAKFKVRTKYVTAGVKGTLFVVDVGEDGVTTIKVIEGNIALDTDPNVPIENSWPSVSLGPGEQVRIWSRQEPQVELIPMSEYEQTIRSITVLEQDLADIPDITEGIAVLRDFKFGGIEGIIKDDYSLFNVWH